MHRRGERSLIARGVSVSRSASFLAALTVTMAVPFSPAAAETSEERQACIGDAFRVCWSAIPNRDDVFHCLLANRVRLNPDCRAVMDRYRRPHHRFRRSTRTTQAD